MQLDQHRRGQRRAGIDDHLQRAGVVAGAVHQVVVGAEQAGFRHAGVAVRVHAVFVAARVRRRDKPKLARQPDIVLHHLPGAPVGAEDRHRERDAAVVAGEAALAQRLDAVARVRLVRERDGIVAAHRLRGAVREHRADAAVGEAVDGALRHLQRCDVVAPVDQRGDAGVDLGQRTDQVGDVVVFGLVARREVAVDVLEIVGRQPLAADAAQCCLPRVHVRIDEARHHDLVGSVDRLVRAGAEIAADRLDPAAAKKHLAVFEIAQLGIERDQPAAQISTRFMTLFSIPALATIDRRPNAQHQSYVGKVRECIAERRATVYRHSGRREAAGSEIRLQVVVIDSGFARHSTSKTRMNALFARARNDTVLSPDRLYLFAGRKLIAPRGGL